MKFGSRSMRFTVGVLGDGKTRYPTDNASGMEFASSKVTSLSLAKGFR